MKCDSRSIETVRSSVRALQRARSQTHTQERPYLHYKAQLQIWRHNMATHEPSVCCVRSSSAADNTALPWQQATTSTLAVTKIIFIPDVILVFARTGVFLVTVSEVLSSSPLALRSCRSLLLASVRFINPLLSQLGYWESHLVFLVIQVAFKAACLTLGAAGGELQVGLMVLITPGTGRCSAPTDLVQPTICTDTHSV